MPNCDFYASIEDHEPLLDWLFAQAACHIYELSSAFEERLRQFRSSKEILREFDRRNPNGEPWRKVHLQIYVLGAGPPFVPRRITLNPEACGGARFRYAAEGWGLIQFYLSTAHGNALENSHTNHNSAKRAEAWADVRDVLGSPASWDFQRITAFSSRLNRQIRKRAVGKLHSRAVLPGAFKLWEGGTSLSPYVPGTHSLQPTT